MLRAKKYFSVVPPEFPKTRALKRDNGRTRTSLLISGNKLRNDNRLPPCTFSPTMRSLKTAMQIETFHQCFCIFTANKDNIFLLFCQ